MPGILEQLPSLVLYAVAGAIIFVIVGYVLAVKRPATKGQIIGHYTFHIWGIDSIEGLTSLGQDVLQDEAFTKLAWLTTKKANPGLNEQEFQNFKEKMQNFHVYGVRKGLQKYLIVTNQNVRTPEIGESPPSERRKFTFPHGWLDKVHVYGSGKGPLHFKGYKVYVMKTVNIQKSLPDLKTFEAMETVGKAVGIMQTSIPLIDEFKALKEENNVLKTKITEVTGQLAQKEHELSVMREALAQKPLGGEAKPTEAKVFQFPKFHFTLTQAVISFIAFAIGAFVIPQHYNMEAFTAGIIVAIPTFIITGFLKKQ
ncbi:MAG: hypothetical protein QXR76_03260 [Candidatus Bathyarchaeia archaeon]